MTERLGFSHTFVFPYELVRDREAFTRAFVVEFERMQRMTLKTVVGFDVFITSVEPMTCQVRRRLDGATECTCE